MNRSSQSTPWTRWDTQASPPSPGRRGDKKASAFIGLVISQDPTSGAPVFGAARMPAYHRAAVAIPGPKHVLTSAERERIGRALRTAVGHIPAWRKSKAARH
jgi:hypothetical protein